MADFAKADARTAALEGGYQAKTSDSGNFYKGLLIGTNRGISAPALAAYLGHVPTVTAMKALTAATASKIRHDGYWVPIHGDQITNQSLAELINDFAVHSGPETAILHVQHALADMGFSLLASGAMDRLTLAALNGSAQQDLFDRIKASRTDFLQHLAAGNPAKDEWLAGWLTRLDSFVFQRPTPAPCASVVG